MSLNRRCLWGDVASSTATINRVAVWRDTALLNTSRTKNSESPRVFSPGSFLYFNQYIHLNPISLGSRSYFEHRLKHASVANLTLGDQRQWQTVIIGSRMIAQC